MSITNDARRLADAASPGPWSASRHYDSLYYVHRPGPPPGEVFDWEMGDVVCVREDAQFIAWCRTGVPVLVDDNEALKAKLAEAAERERDADRRADAWMSEHAALTARLAAVEAERDTLRKLREADRAMAGAMHDGALVDRRRAGVAEGLLASIRKAAVGRAQFGMGSASDYDHGVRNCALSVLALLGTDQEHAPTEPTCMHCGQVVDQRNLAHDCPAVGYSLSTLGCATSPKTAPTEDSQR